MHSHQPGLLVWFEVVSWLLGDLPFPSFETICTVSPARMVSSLDRSLVKSYRTLAIDFFGAGGAAGGGGGGALMEPVELVWACDAAAAATGWEAGFGCGGGAGCAAGVGR